MQSLKELRAENAARQLSRTARDDLAATSGELGTASAPGAAAAGAPRASRTLAPLALAGSLFSGTNRDCARSNDGTAVDDDPQQEEDRETRSRRRRRRRQREQRSKDDDEGNDDDATALSIASRTSAVEEGKESTAGTERRAAKRDILDEKNEEAGASRRLATEDVDDSAGAARPSNTRGAPPQQKPKKKLTPLAARRARIEQQKREEAERALEAHRELPAASPSHLPPNNNEANRETSLEQERESKYQNERHSAGRSDEGNSVRARGGTVVTNQRGTKNVDGAQGVTNPGDREQAGLSEKGEGGNTEHDPLISDATGQRRTGDDAGNQAGNAVAGPGASIGNGDQTAGAGELEDAAEGRFKGMRSRMKQAGKGLMNKSPTASFRRPKAEGKTGRGSASSQEKEELPEGRSTGDVQSDDGAGNGTREAGDDDDVDRTASKNLRHHKTESDTASNDSALSPVRSEEENDNFDDDSDAEDEGGKERKKKWGRGKDPIEAAAGADKEVTLGHVVDRKMREMGYIRKPPVDELKNRRSLRDRVAAEAAPEVHFIGELSGAEGFGSGVSCRFRVEGGRHWTCLAGLEEGQTHVMHVDYGESFAPWNHPIDLHYTTKSIQGWPRVMVQVWQLDTHGRNVLCGYGFRHLPSTPGFSEVSVPCWRPTGTMQEETAAFFLGVTPRLTAEDAVFNRAWDQRCRLVTLPAGTVWIQVNGLFRNLEDQGVDSLLFS